MQYITSTSMPGVIATLIYFAVSITFMVRAGLRLTWLRLLFWCAAIAPSFITITATLTPDGWAANSWNCAAAAIAGLFLVAAVRVLPPAEEGARWAPIRQRMVDAASSVGWAEALFVFTAAHTFGDVLSAYRFDGVVPGDPVIGGAGWKDGLVWAPLFMVGLYLMLDTFVPPRAVAKTKFGACRNEVDRYDESHERH